MKKNLQMRCCSSLTKFAEEVQKRLKTAKPNQYILGSVDFDNFKYINDLFGYEAGNQTLASVTEYFEKQLEIDEVFARINADNFVFFLKAEEEQVLTKRFLSMVDVKQYLCSFLPSHYNFVASGGFYYIGDITEQISSMIDKANFARKKAKGNHISTFLNYSKEMSDELKWKKEITLSMELALNNQEFEMYLQPKLLLKNNEVIGAEALVRWNSKKNGMIYPDKFIPVFEQNGFIKLLDFYMLEQACLFLKKCIVDDVNPLPISVNFSKVHIGTPNLVEKIFSVVNKHGISPKLIEIELTESVFSRNFQKLIEIASGLKYLGFKVSLDDFGSGYSSLNYLKDLPVDIIKIDKGFLNSSTNTDKGRLIITKVVELIKALRLMTVMEGVETQEQVEFLSKLNCDIGQGYYYAKPMPVHSYEEFVKYNMSYIVDTENVITETNNKDYLYEIPKEFEMDNWELYVLGQNIDMGLMKGYLDGEATVQYVNRKALEYLGYTAEEFREIFNNSIVAFTHPDDAHIMQANVKQLIESGKPRSFKTRAIRKDGKVIHLQGRSSCIIDNQGRPIGLYAFQDVTEELERTSILEKTLKDQIKENEILIASIQGGVITCEFNSKTGTSKTLYISEGWTELTGYTLKELNDNLGGNPQALVFKEDKDKADRDYMEQVTNGNSYMLQYRLKRKDGRIIWVMDKGIVTTSKDGLNRNQSIITDISEIKKQEEILRLNEERYKIIVEQSNDIMFEWDFATDIMHFSDKYEEVFGFPPIEDNISKNEAVFERIHPDDITELKSWIKNTFRKNNKVSSEFRFRMIDNSYIWMKSSMTTICDENGVPIKAIGVFINIDNQKSTIDYLKQKSQQDSLTKLYNKEETRERIEKCIAESNSDEKLAMFIVDIDNFKGVNDNLGHQFGDTVLLDVAKKIKSLFCSTDIVGRLGGDEFIVFMKNIKNEDDIYEKADALIKILRNNYFGEKKEYKISASIGIAYYPQHGINFDELYKFADIALYESKNKSKDCYTIYYDNMTDKTVYSRTSLDNLERFVTNYFEGDLIYNIFEMLYETKDIKITLNMILEILGKRFVVDRAFIFEQSEDGQFYSNTYEWCADGISHEIQTLQNIPSIEFGDSVTSYSNEGIFFCNDIDILNDKSFEIFKRQGMKSFLHCAIFNGGKCKGFIGFGDCKNKRVWRGEEIATLGYISRILSVFLLKNQISKELWVSYRNYTDMMDDLNDYIYVIDSKTYKILYLNKATEALSINEGDKCHKIIFSQDTPCENCPVRLLNSQTLFASEDIYSTKINTWVKSSASKVKWTDEKDAVLIHCTKIEEDEKTLI